MESAHELKYLKGQCDPYIWDMTGHLSKDAVSNISCPDRITLLHYPCKPPTSQGTMHTK